MNSEEAVSLRAHVANLQEDFAGELALDGQIVLSRVLRAQSLWELAEEKNGPIKRPVHGLVPRSEEHTSELQSRLHLVCRLLLEKKKPKHIHRVESQCPRDAQHQHATARVGD